MRLFQLLFRASPAALLLVLCLQLGSNKAQENTTSPRIIILDFQLARVEDEKQEVTADLKVQTELKECMVIKAFLSSNVHIEGGFSFKYTACLCEDNPRRFFWDFKTNSTAQIAAVVDIVRELYICPDDDAVIPIKANRFYTVKTLPAA
ncbi:prolactin-inducible protein [Saimiri boliviensis]|uniref:Prolactin-induced protein n=1 Tax=Saimiri boliviensis boliviensis TaxID=39432 RepID=A0A2K6SDK3_SAIBB|nr:prolactin-inducible protein [Saimiri boliviensis boliviensis]